MKDIIKELEEKVNSCLILNNVVDKLDIKPIKDEMKKIIELDHERNKRTLNLIIFGLKEEVDDDTLALTHTELHNEALSPRFREPLLDCLIEKLVNVGDEDRTSNF